MLMRRTTEKVITAIILGTITGDVIGALIHRFLPESPLRDLLVNQVSVGFNYFEVNLLIVDFGLKLMISFNLLAIIFMFLMIYLLHKF